MQSSLILGAISCFAPIFFGPHLANASLAGDHVSVTRSSGSIVVHSPTEAEVTDISTNPQLTFKPLGDLNTIVAFARLQASIDLGEIADACDVATSAMKTIWTLAPPDSYAHQYASDTPMVVEVFMDTRQELQDACNNLDNWDAPDNFFTERSYPHRRSPNEPLPTPALDHARNAAFLFGTVEPEMRPTPNGTAADPDDRIARADPITIASVVIGGSMLLLTLFQMLFGGSTPTWSMDAATQHIANGARSSANALAQLCEKITKVWHFDEFMNYVNGARDNAKDLIGLINDIRRAIFQLLLGNISPVFLTSLNIQAALSSEAAAHHLRLAVRSAADVIQMPAFGIRADRTLKIVVPIPVASDTLAAHEFAGTPAGPRCSLDPPTTASPSSLHSRRTPASPSTDPHPTTSSSTQGICLVASRSTRPTCAQSFRSVPTGRLPASAACSRPTQEVSRSNACSANTANPGTWPGQAAASSSSPPLCPPPPPPAAPRATPNRSPSIPVSSA